MQQWSVIQGRLLPNLKGDVGVLTPKLAKLVYLREWARIEEITCSNWLGVGRPPLECAWFANTLVALSGQDLVHVPLADHNPRKGEEIEFDPAQAVRYNDRTIAKRSSARLKYRTINVMAQGVTKVMGHLMFGVLVLSADQLMRLLL